MTTPVISLALARIRAGLAKLRRGAVAATRWLVGQVPEALLLGGAAAITYGVASVYRPAGWVMGGLLALAAGWRLGRG